MDIKFLIAEFGCLSIALGTVFCSSAFPRDSSVHRQIDCGYYMCRYEEENIDTVILGHAAESRVVMFGEIHDSVVADDPPPLEDSLYVISLLERFRSLGYGYLALEVQENAPLETHSHDMVRCLKDYLQGKQIHAKDYPNAKPGWVNLMIKALQIGFKPIFFESTKKGADRDAEMFRAIKQRIFDRDPHAKTLVYVGASHILKQPKRARYAGRSVIYRPLGLLLNELTKGKNYSVYAGYPDDTPSGCDLIISSFVWDTYRGFKRHTLPTP